MFQRLSARPRMRRPGFFIVLTVLLTAMAAAWPTAGTAADGAPLFADGHLLAGYSQTAPSLDGPVVAFEARESLGGGTFADPLIAVANLETGDTWFLKDRQSPEPGDDPVVFAGKQYSAVAQVDGAVLRVVWVQEDMESGYDTSLWIWQGTPEGTAAVGFPRQLVDGPVRPAPASPANSLQAYPDIGTSNVNGVDQTIVAWEDSRLSATTVKQVFWLSLSADADANDTPDYMEPAFDPASAGSRADPSADVEKAQYAPSVGPAGVFWTDDRWSTWPPFESRVVRLDLSPAVPAATGYSTIVPDSFGDITNPRATAAGCAWLGQGPAAGPYLPYLRPVTSPAEKPVAAVFDPGWLAADHVGVRDVLAVTGRHGATDADEDVWLWDALSRQKTAVCTLSSDELDLARERNRVSQTRPSIDARAADTLVVWEDARHNDIGQATSRWSYRLYGAQVPQVTLRASRLKLRAGSRLKLTGTVTPAFPGVGVRFQRGKRSTDPVLRTSRYGSWRTLKTQRLGIASQATWTWRPAKAGVYYLRAWFPGDARYGLPHVGSGSAVLRVRVTR